MCIRANFISNTGLEKFNYNLNIMFIAIKKGCSLKVAL